MMQIVCHCDCQIFPQLLLHSQVYTVSLMPLVHVGHRNSRNSCDSTNYVYKIDAGFENKLVLTINLRIKFYSIREQQHVALIKNSSVKSICYVRVMRPKSKRSSVKP